MATSEAGTEPTSTAQANTCTSTYSTVHSTYSTVKYSTAKHLHQHGEPGLGDCRVVHAGRGQPRGRAQQQPRHVRGPGHVLGRVTGPRGGQVHVERGRGEQQT